MNTSAWQSLRQAGQRAAAAEVRVAELFDAVPEAVGERQQQPVVRRPCLYLSERPILKSRPLPTSTNGMLSSVCELPLPSSLVQTIERVVEQAAVAARFGRFGQPLGQVGELLAVPVVDLASASPATSSLLSGSCDSSWWPFVDAEPLHPGAADRVGVLQRGDAGEVGREAVDHQLDLHLADLGHVVVLFLDARLELRHGVAERSPSPAFSSCSNSRTNVACSSSSWRSSALTSR